MKHDPMTGPWPPEWMNDMIEGYWEYSSDDPKPRLSLAQLAWEAYEKGHADAEGEKWKADYKATRKELVYRREQVGRLARERDEALQQRDAGRMAWEETDEQRREAIAQRDVAVAALRRIASEGTTRDAEADRDHLQNIAREALAGKEKE